MTAPDQTVSLRPFREADRAALLALRLAPGQDEWTHHPAELLPEIAGNAKRTPITVLHSEAPVGLLILSRDERADSYAGQPDPQALILNGLSLDQSVQGRGIGRRVMEELPALARTLHPDATRILPCVHQTNSGAIHTNCG